MLRWVRTRVADHGEFFDGYGSNNEEHSVSSFHVFNYMSNNVRGFCCRAIQTFRPLPGGPGEQKDLGMSRRLVRPFPFLSCRRELRHDTRPVP